MMITIDTTEIYTPTPETEGLRRFREAYPEKQAEISGVKWNYYKVGQGPDTLLNLPGILGVGEMSFQQILSFKDKFQVIVPSYPVSIMTVDELVVGLHGLLASEGVEKVNVLGSSFGGLVAQRLVRKYPELVKNLILSHTGGPEPERVEKNKKFTSLLRWLPMRLLRALLRQVTRKSLEEAGEGKAFWIDYSNDIIAGLSRKDIISRYQIAIDFDATSSFSPEDLKNWPGRILILEGEDDPIAEVPAREALKRLYPIAEVHTFQGSGHVASIARLPEYTEIVTEFLKKNW